MSHRSEERERERDREREREKERERDREKDRDRRREKEKEREREKEREKSNSRRTDKKLASNKTKRTIEAFSNALSLEEEDKIQKRRKKLEEWKKQNETILTNLQEISKQETSPSNDESKEEEQSKPMDEEETPVKEVPPSDEPDPLDLYMEQIQDEVKKIPAPPSKPIPIDEEPVVKKASVLKQMQLQQKAPPVVLEESEEEEEEEENSDEDKPIVSKKYKKKENLLSRDQSGIIWEPFMKNLYVEVPEITKMPEEEVWEYREKLDGIRIRGKNCPRPIKKFTQCGLTSQILEVMEKNNYESPTPIQAQAIPAIMSGRDVIGIAKTGSGKTLAFLLPLLRQIINQPPLQPGDGPIGIVLAPTRELAIQIFTEAKKFSKPLKIRAVCCYGGGPVSEQIADLKRGADIVVATPGRMIDLLCANSGRVTNLLRVTMVILDEADRMFDMGFEPQIMAIVNNVRPDRQLLMFSATFPIKVERAAKQIMQRPLEIVTGLRNVVCADVEQKVEVIEADQKWGRLLTILADYYGKGSILIFVDTQGMADTLFMKLLKAGYDALSLHGGKDQQDRISTISDFKKKLKSILVATSVAARGLDVKDLNLVINYEVPNHIEDYVHRVGRTGRAGKKGTAITFIQPDEDEHGPGIMKALQDSAAEIPEALEELVHNYLKKKNEGAIVKFERSGYMTRGFAFDDEEHAKKKKIERLTYGLVENEEEEEEMTAIVLRNEEDRNKQNSRFSTPQSVTPPTKRQSAEQKAAAIAEILSRSKASKEEGTYLEIEINDYPQMTRWNVTNRETTARIQEWTGTSIVCKGVFVPMGRNPPPGERKLYLQIEGPNKQSVDLAKREIKGILAEAVSDPTGNLRDQARYGSHSY